MEKKNGFGSKNERDFFARGLSDWLKRAVQSGVSVEPLISLLGQADKTKKEIMSLMAKEVRQFLDNIQVQDILKKVLSNATLEVEAKIRLVQVEEKAAKPKAFVKRLKSKGRSKKTS